MPASSQETLYSILGVSFDISPDELKSAFRKRAAAVHPDRNPSDPHAARRFREVKDAYDVLADEERRKLYDTFGTDSLKDGFDVEAERARRATRDREPKGQREGRHRPLWGVGGRAW